MTVHFVPGEVRHQSMRSRATKTNCHRNLARIFAITALLLAAPVAEAAQETPDIATQYAADAQAMCDLVPKVY
ncbi:MAG: hypothetical protein ACK5YG_05925, partial [Alphaproteobacteria bacterium]